MSFDVLLLFFLSAALGVGEVVGADPVTINILEAAKSGKSMTLKLDSDELKFTATRGKGDNCEKRNEMEYLIDSCPIKMMWSTNSFEVGSFGSSDNVVTVTHTSGKTHLGKNSENVNCLEIDKSKQVNFTVKPTDGITCPLTIEFIGAGDAAATDASGLSILWILLAAGTVGGAVLAFIIFCLVRKFRKPKDDMLMAAITAIEEAKVQRKHKGKRTPYEKPSDSVMGLAPRGRTSKGRKDKDGKQMSPIVMSRPPNAKKPKKNDASSKSIDKSIDKSVDKSANKSVQKTTDATE